MTIKPLVCLIVAAATASPLTATTFAVQSDFAAGRLIFDDVERFYAAVELARTNADPVAVLQKEYLDKGSPGLQFYHESGRIQDADYVWRVFRRYTQYYSAVHEFADNARSHRDALTRPFEFFANLRPESRTPPVYFIIGHFRGGATAFEGGLVIALDNWAADWGDFDPDRKSADIILNDPIATLLPLVSHELVHFHQACSADCGSLLADSLQEGVADFIAWRITGARTNIFQQATYDYYDGHERELWPRFKREMTGTEHGIWLYNNDLTDMPHNLGYAVGFRIAEAYFRRQPDKRQALIDLLRRTDVDRVLLESGYDGGT